MHVVHETWNNNIKYIAVVSIMARNENINKMKTVNAASRRTRRK